MNTNTGILWFNNDKKLSLTEKVQGAAAEVKRKYGHEAEFCLVNPGDAADSNLEEIGKECNLIVQARAYVLPFCFWCGFEDMDAILQMEAR